MNHIHIGSKNVGVSRAFYEKHFGFRLKTEHGDGVFLVNDAGFLLAIDPVEQVPSLPTWFYVGLRLPNAISVRRIAASLEIDGCRFSTPYQEFGNDAVSLCCLDPDGYKIEVSWHAQ